MTFLSWKMKVRSNTLDVESIEERSLSRAFILKSEKWKYENQNYRSQKSESELKVRSKAVTNKKVLIGAEKKKVV